MLTPEQLAEIEARAEAATRGRWEIYESRSDGAYIGRALSETETEPIIWGTRYSGVMDEDLVFAAHARADIPALLAEVRRLRERSDDLGQIVEEARRVARAFEDSYYSFVFMELRDLLDIYADEGNKKADGPPG